MGRLRDPVRRHSREGGIYSPSHWKCAADGVDSRLRGNDRCSERDPIPNDTTTQSGFRQSP
jgi:hypothetical protein